MSHLCNVNTHNYFHTLIHFDSLQVNHRPSQVLNLRHSPHLSLVRWLVFLIAISFEIDLFGTLLISLWTLLFISVAI